MRRVGMLLRPLAGNPHHVGNLRRGLPVAGSGNCPQNLPTSASQPEWSGKCVSPFEHFSVGPEKGYNCLREQRGDIWLHKAGLTAIN